MKYIIRPPPCVLSVIEKLLTILILVIRLKEIIMKYNKMLDVLKITDVSITKSNNGSTYILPMNLSRKKTIKLLEQYDESWSVLQHGPDNYLSSCGCATKNKPIRVLLKGHVHNIGYCCSDCGEFTVSTNCSSAYNPKIVWYNISEKENKVRISFIARMYGIVSNNDEKTIRYYPISLKKMIVFNTKTGITYECRNGVYNITYSSVFNHRYNYIPKNIIKQAANLVLCKLFDLGYKYLPSISNIKTLGDLVLLNRYASDSIPSNYSKLFIQACNSPLPAYIKLNLRSLLQSSTRIEIKNLWKDSKILRTRPDLFPVYSIFMKQTTFSKSEITWFLTEYAKGWDWIKYAGYYSIDRYLPDILERSLLFFNNRRVLGTFLRIGNTLDPLSELVKTRIIFRDTFRPLSRVMHNRDFIQAFSQNSLLDMHNILVNMECNEPPRLNYTNEYLSTTVHNREELEVPYITGNFEISPLNYRDKNHIYGIWKELNLCVPGYEEAHCSNDTIVLEIKKDNRTLGCFEVNSLVSDNSHKNRVIQAEGKEHSKLDVYSRKIIIDWCRLHQVSYRQCKSLK